MKLLLFSACLKLLNSTPGDLRSANFTALLGYGNGAACLNSIAKGDQGASSQPSATSWAMDAMDAMDGGNYNDTPPPRSRLVMTHHLSLSRFNRNF